MIETKIIIKQKSEGTATGATATVGTSGITQTDHAILADKAKRADAADKASYADTAGYATRSKYASMAGDLDPEASVFEKFLRKDIDDKAQGVITFVKGLVAQALSVFEKGLRAEGLSTFTKGLTAQALSNFEKGLTAQELTTLQELWVKADARFDGQLSSPDFVSGFLDGRGWRIKNTPTVNAAGVEENRYTEEIDNLVVRGSMRVYEMIISQLLGENDNRIFTAMMEVDHYDSATGKVYLDTQGGKMLNPFRKDDCIMVQQYNGMPSEENDHYVTKQYELVVTEVGSEGTGEEMLAWVRFRNFTSSMDGATASSLIRKRDTFVRVDNLSDPDRKGIIQMMTVGTDTPYMDIIHGLKTNPDQALKGRLGNLQGIVHPVFGALEGFGEFLQNLYATGDLIMRRTGDNLDTRLEMMRSQFATRFAQTSYELTEEDNYLHNGQFLAMTDTADGSLIIDGWTIDPTDDSLFWVDADGMPVMVNGTVTAGGNRRVTIENNEGRQMLRLQNSGVSQAIDLIRQPQTHKEYTEPSGATNADTQLKTTGKDSKDVQDQLYISLRLYANTAGTLTIGFDGCQAVEGKVNELAKKTVSVAYSGQWQTVELSGKWNGTGTGFVLQYSGDALISMLTLTDRPLDNLQKTVSTQILQTAKNIQLLGENIDKVNGKTTQLGIDLDAEKEAIRLYVDEQYTNLDEHLTSEINIQAGRIDLLNTWKNETTTKISGITTDIDSIRTTVGKAATKEELKSAQSTLEDTISSNYESLSTDIGRAWNHADSVGDDIRYDYGATITLVNQKADSWTAAAGRFDTNGHLRDTSYLTTTADMNALMSEHFNADGSLKNVSGLVTSSTYSGLVARVEETESGLSDANSSISDATQRIVKAEAKIETSVQKDGDGWISNAKIKADRIVLEGAVTANNYFKILTDGSMEAKAGTIGGLKISGNSLTNDGLNNDAYIVMRNDTNKVFAGIGGNVLPSSTGTRAVARFENNNTAGYFGETNYAAIVGASGASTNIALAITGGYVTGLRLRGELYSGGTASSPTEIEKGVNVVELNGSGYYRLPVMRKEDDGYVMFVKRTLTGSKDSNVKLKTNTCIDGSGNYRTGFFLYDSGDAASEITLGSCGDAMILVYQRDQTNTALSSSSYKGAWVQFKCPRDW